MTLTEILQSPVAAAVPPAVAGAWLAYLRYKLAAKRLELGKCPSCDKPDQPDLPSIAPLLLLLLSVGAGMAAWVQPTAAAALARAAGDPQQPGPKPPGKSCWPSCPSGQSCDTRSGTCVGAAAERKPRPRRAESQQRGPVSAAAQPGWVPCCPDPFGRSEPTL